MTTPLKITTAALSLINNLLLDARLIGQAAETHTINDAYAAMHATKMDLCEYVAGLERELERYQAQTVKR